MMTREEHGNRVTRVRCFKAPLTAVCPLKTSSGHVETTDSDVLVDAAGKPFVPGTTLAGVMRHHLDATNWNQPATQNPETRQKSKQKDTDQSEFENPLVRKWFGYIVPYKDEGKESRVRVFDAFPSESSNMSISIRDGVKLDEFKTAEPQGKFDYQIVDAGAEFLFRMQIFYCSDEKDEVDDFLHTVWSGFQSGDIRIGGKTTRGFGLIELGVPETLDIDLKTAEGIEEYINFDWNSDWSSNAAKVADSWKKPAGSELFEQRSYELRLSSFLMIRDYATIEKSGYEGRLVAAETLCAPALNNETASAWKGKVPIVPGTTWAGAFKAHMFKILMRAGYKREEANGFLERIYGKAENGSAKSNIEFTESRIQNTKPLNATRNAIDRFTGGAADQKLFTNRMAYPDDSAKDDCGKTTLVIRWKKDIDLGDRKLLESLIDISIQDLLKGHLAVGGMTAVGAGLFSSAYSTETEGENE